MFMDEPLTGASLRSYLRGAAAESARNTWVPLMQRTGVIPHRIILGLIQDSNFVTANSPGAGDASAPTIIGSPRAWFLGGRSVLARRHRRKFRHKLPKNRHDSCFVAIFPSFPPKKSVKTLRSGRNGS